MRPSFGLTIEIPFTGRGPLRKKEAELTDSGKPLKLKGLSRHIASSGELLRSGGMFQFDTDRCISEAIIRCLPTMQKYVEGR
jgi:hypothetical protein